MMMHIMLFLVCFGGVSLIYVMSDIHGCYRQFKQALELMPNDPNTWYPDILMHRGRNRTNHPAVAVALSDIPPHRLRRFAVPQFVPGLGIQIAHDLLVLGAVAGHHIAVGVDEEGIEAHVAGQQALLTVDVVDQAVVEVSAHPLLGTLGPQQFVDQILEMLGDHGPVMDDVLGFHEIEAVMQGCSGKFHAHLI